MKPTIVRYPIPGNDAGGLLHIYGKRGTTRKAAAATASKNVILYCGGWPDGVDIFAPLAMRLAAATNDNNDNKTSTTHELHDDDDDDDGCYVRITCWPGFDAATYEESKFRGFRRGGYTFSEVSCCIREAAKRLFIEYNKNNNNNNNNNSVEDYSEHDDDNDEEHKRHHRPTTFTVIFHDFGVLPGLMFANRSINDRDLGRAEHVPDRIVLLDVLLGPHILRNSIRSYRSPRCYYDYYYDCYCYYLSAYTARELLVYLAYRGTFACAFAMLRYISEAMGLLTFRIMYAFVLLLGLAPLHPRSNDMNLLNERNMNKYHMVYTFYPYYHLFRALLFDDEGLDQGCLPLDLAKTPILYLYGEDKNVVSTLTTVLAVCSATTTTTISTYWRIFTILFVHPAADFVRDFIS